MNLPQPSTLLTSLVAGGAGAPLATVLVAYLKTKGFDLGPSYDAPLVGALAAGLGGISAYVKPVLDSFVALIVAVNSAIEKHLIVTIQSAPAAAKTVTSL